MRATVLTVDWYVSQTARLHLNAFCVDLVRPVDFNDMDAILSASVTDPEGATGSTGLLRTPREKERERERAARRTREVSPVDHKMTGLGVPLN
jgi:hypothetical protein